MRGAARFDQAAEVTLDELRVELMYPLDDAAERYFRERADPAGFARMETFIDTSGSAV